ncbi:PLD nuclease N-terminal domain-containing protein [Pseudoruegeria sp. HB172150]|uniref:PLD nuclease N-terminal domain-containing protein n=1 Tax=Pseudoruegeria sp. HB172150 TaxID=2721164 RepID=UPI0020A68B9F|nr:PLD nuclease N-terminal domain-containing protein [Pseudoruegeria sp. HB172150]
MAELSMFELSGIGGLILLALDVYALVNIFQSRTSTGGKVAWVLGVVVFPFLGFLVWLFFGPRKAQQHA